MTPSSFRSTEIVALAQLVLTRRFQGPVRTATAQELLHHARLALGRGEALLASDLAGLASEMMSGGDLGADLMQEGGGALAAGLAPDRDAGNRLPAAQDRSGPEAELATRALPGLHVLDLKERGVVLEEPADPPRRLPARLATEWRPRALPRT